MDIKAVSHAVLDTSVEFHTFGLQIAELLQPSLAGWIGNGDGVDGHRPADHAPPRRRLGQARIFHEGHIVVVCATGAGAAVESHPGWVRTVRRWLQLADLLHADDFGPELVALFEVAHVQHEMIDAARGDRLVRHRVFSLGVILSSLEPSSLRSLRRYHKA